MLGTVPLEGAAPMANFPVSSRLAFTNKRRFDIRVILAIFSMDASDSISIKTFVLT